MKKAEIIKYIVGYFMGFVVFVILIPYMIYAISQVASQRFHIPVFVLNAANYIIAFPFFIIGLVFVIWSNSDLFKIGRGGPADIFNIAVSPRSKNLVISGPYRYTRNPMVFGMNSIYFSIALYLNSLASIFFVILFLLVIIMYLKLTEEKRLSKDFGDDYLKYKKNVSMIIPFPVKRINNNEEKYK